jgi:glycosyltransferase involved in cell wall biosynthesis
MHSEFPLVSVIIPCYNVSEFVEKALESILTQTYINLEVWVVDDASTDDTLQKIKRIADDRIKIIAYNQNTQKIGAVNEVLKKVTGELICFQDSDDWSEPMRIQKQVDQFRLNQKLGICFTNYRYTGKRSGTPERISISNDELKDEFLEYGQRKNTSFDTTICGTMMISKQVLKSTGGYHPYFKGRVGEDIHWIYRILKQFSGITIPEVLYNYCAREGSFTGMQFAGRNAKYAYSWPLIRKIIFKDVHEDVDVLSVENKQLLHQLELEACEEALVESIQLRNQIINSYQTSRVFIIGETILRPFRTIRRCVKKNK